MKDKVTSQCKFSNQNKPKGETIHTIHKKIYKHVGEIESKIKISNKKKYYLKLKKKHIINK